MATDGIFGKIYDYQLYCGNSTEILSEVFTAGECSESWKHFWAPFIYIREELELIVCIVGSIANLLNLLVFTRKNMQSATSSIFTALAVADFLFVSQQVVASSLNVNRKYNGDTRTYNQIIIEKILLLYCFEIFHGWSVGLTLLVAIWRYIGVIHPLRCRKWCTKKRAKLAIFCMLVFSTAVIAFICLVIQIQECKQDGNSEARRHRYLVIYVLVVKVIPCSLLTFFSIALIYSLVQAKRNRRLLVSSGEKILEQLVVNTTFSISVVGRSGQKNQPQQHQQQQGNGYKSRSESCCSGSELVLDPVLKKTASTSTMTMSSGGTASKIINNNNRRDQIELDRTTKTLVVLLLLFLFTETPFGILELASIDRIDHRNPTFYMDCYFPVLSFFVFDELMSSASSFFVYLIMSKTFRMTFTNMTVQLFKRFLR